jgi:hypothetical protein
MIGTSPVVILEAMKLSQLGYKVTMVDSSDRIGGAWKAISWLGYQGVENGIHYLTYSKIGYDFIEGVIGKQLEYVKHKYVFLTRRGISFKVRSNCFLGYLANLILKDSWSNLFYRIAGLYKGYKGRYKYFTRGSADFILTLESWLRKSDVEVILGAFVESIDLCTKSGSVHALLSDGTSLHASRIYITSGANLKVLRLNGGIHRIEKVIIDRPQIFLEIDDMCPTFKFYEGLFPGDEVLRYVHDISRFLGKESQMPASRRIIVVAVSLSATIDQRIVEAVFKRLQFFRILSSESVLLNSYVENVRLPELTPGELRRLESDLAPLVVTLDTEDLACSFARYLTRWNNLYREGCK